MGRLLWYSETRFVRCLHLPEVLRQVGGLAVTGVQLQGPVNGIARGIEQVHLDIACRHLHQRFSVFGT